MLNWHFTCSFDFPSAKIAINHTNIGKIGDISCKICSSKLVNILFPISFNMCFGAQKNRLIETVLLSTDNI